MCFPIGLSRHVGLRWVLLSTDMMFSGKGVSVSDQACWSSMGLRLNFFFGKLVKYKYIMRLVFLKMTTQKFSNVYLKTCHSIHQLDERDYLRIVISLDNFEHCSTGGTPGTQEESRNLDNYQYFSFGSSLGE